MKHRLVAWLGALSLALAVAVPAAPDRGALLITNAYGLADSALQQKWESQVLASVHGATVGFQGGLPALDGPASTVLTDVQRQALLTAPDLLTSSSYVNQVLPARWLLELSIATGDNPAMHPELVDLSTREVQVLPDAHGKTVDDTLAELGKAVDDYFNHTAPGDEQAVKGNVLSKMYHLSNADHVPAEDCVTFASAAEARAHGYRPCPICFPKAASLVDNDKTEVTLGRELSAEIEDEYKPCRDEVLKARIDTIGQKLVDDSDIRDFPYSFTVLDTEEVNAFSAGAGHVFITTGIIKRLESDDEVATVLGHEIAHCENHHIIRTYRSMETMNIVGILVGAATGGLGRVATNFMGLIFSRGYSRNFELQADHGGLLYAYAAGYDPHAFVLTLKKLRDEEKNHKGGKPPAWLRTHPAEEQRIDQIGIELDHLQAFDKQVQEERTHDPGLADEMRRHAAYYVDHPEVLQGFMSAWQALKLDPTQPVTAAPPTPVPPHPTTDPDARD